MSNVKPVYGKYCVNHIKMLNIFAAVNWVKWVLKMNSLSTFHKMYRSPMPDCQPAVLASIIF